MNTQKRNAISVIAFLAFISIAIFIISQITESNEANSNRSASIGSQRAALAAIKPMSEQIEDMKTLAKCSASDRLQLIYEVEETHFLPWNPGDNLIIAGMTLEEQKEWIAQQQSPRSQLMTRIITISPSGWGYEDVSEPGDIYPKGRHQSVFYDFDKKEMKHGIFIPEPVEATTPFDMEISKIFKNVILAIRTPSELIGDFDQLPFYDGGNHYTEKLAQINDKVTKTLVADSSNELMLSADLSAATGHLNSAKYYEEPWVVRELSYANYETDSSIGKEIPHRVIFKRYGNTTLDDLPEDKLLEKFTFELVEIKKEV